MTEGWALAVEAAGKVGVYTSLLLAVGACVARWLLPRASAALGPGDRTRIDRALATVARFAAGGLLLALTFRVWLHTGATFGWAAMATWERLRLIAIESRWGAAWRVQMLAAAVLAIAALTIRPGRQAGWIVTGVAAAGACAALPLVGHAAGSPARMVLHALHAAGGGIWLGTLGAVVLAARAPEDRQALLHHFSRIALGGAALIVATGLVAAWIYLGGLAPLWTTAYGRVLVVKVAVVAAAASCGYVNWQYFRRLRAEGRVEQVSGSGSARIQSMVVLEALLFLVIVVITSVLTELAHP